MADQWFGQNWVVGKKDGRPLYMNVITGEMTSTPPPTNLSAVAARMSAVNQVNDAEPMDCENELSVHATSSSHGDAPDRKKKRLTCDVDAPAQFPIPRAQYITGGVFSPPPIALGNNCGILPSSARDVSRSISPTSPLFKEDEFLKADGFDLDLDILMTSTPSPTTSSTNSQTVSNTSTPSVSTLQTPAQPYPTGFAPVPILPAGFPRVRMAQPVAEPLTSAQKATIRKIKRRESAEKSRQRRQAKLKSQENKIQQLQEHIIKLNQQLAAAAAQNAAQREQINFLQSLVTSTIPNRTQSSLP